MSAGPLHPGALLREAAKAKTLWVPGAFNALAGLLVERAGGDAVYLSGAALSAGSLGLPDIGLITLPELITHTTYLTRRLKIPVIVDADTGFGEAANVERTVIELEAAGAAALQLEDQQLPKRCGHLSGKSLVSTEEMATKIRAAVSARKNPAFVIIARTDARGVTNLDDAVARAEAYVRAGADWIFPEALSSAAEFSEFARRVPVPLVANMTEFGKSPLLPFTMLASLRYAAVLYPVTLLRLAMKAAEQGLAAIKQAGTQESLLPLMQTRSELYDLLRYSDFEARDRAHFGGTSDT